jgi:hypothetical protein
LYITFFLFVCIAEIVEYFQSLAQIQIPISESKLDDLLNIIFVYKPKDSKSSVFVGKKNKLPKLYSQSPTDDSSISKSKKSKQSTKSLPPLSFSTASSTSASFSQPQYQSIVTDLCTSADSVETSCSCEFADGEAGYKCATCGIGLDDITIIIFPKMILVLFVKSALKKKSMKITALGGFIN